MVGVQGFEPWTPCSQSRCATRLRYTPTESIFYTEMPQSGKYCNIRPMGALFFSKSSKQLRVLIALGFLLFGILGNQYLGFMHSIAHTGFQQSNTELSSTDKEVSFGISHGSAACHLFDALTLAGFIAPNIQSSVSTTNYSENSFVFTNLPTAQVSKASYQSRAPPIPTL